MYNFESILKKNKFPAEGPSTSTRRKIKEFRDLEGKIQAAKAHLATVKTERKKIDLKNEIAEAEAALPVMDAELCDSLNKYVKNQDVYAANGARLKDSRTAKTTTPAEPANTPEPEPAPEPAKPEPAKTTNTEPAPAQKTDPKTEPAKAKDGTVEKKKSGGVWGWVLGAVGIVVAIAVGKNMIDNGKL